MVQSTLTPTALPTLIDMATAAEHLGVSLWIDAQRIEPAGRSRRV
jgi:hypothetical protein